MTELLRAADPAAGVVADPYGAEARALLARITATPAGKLPPLRRRGVRFTLAAAGVAALATVVLAAPMPWRHGAGLTGSAYAVTRHVDGSFRVVVHWNELRDPGRLQAALDRAGAPVRVLTGTVRPPTDHPAPPPSCAEPTYGQPYSARAVQWDFPNQASEVDGFVVHPDAFPRGGTLVVEVFFPPGSRAPASTLSYLVVGRVPTCAQPVYGASR